MALTHAEIVTQVEEDTGRSDKTTQIGKYVYRAQYTIVRDAALIFHHDFHCLRKESYTDTVDGTKTYAFPSTLKSFYDIRICESTNKRKLRTLTPRYQDLRRPYPEDDTEGVPVYYIPWGRYFEVSPVADDAYTMYLRWTKWPAEQATGAASDLLYMDEVIIKCTDWLTVLSLNLEKDIRRFKSEYKDLLAGAVQVDKESHKYDIKLQAQPFVSTSVDLDELSNYWLKPSVMSSP